jgi:hypothetical protein
MEQVGTVEHTPARPVVLFGERRGALKAYPDKTSRMVRPDILDLAARK